MQVLFPSDPSSPRAVEPDFSVECDAARSAGFDVGVVDCELAMRGDAVGATARVTRGDGAAIYRGWMLRPGSYASLYAELERREVTLINSPAAYQTCHYLPDGYRWIDGNTARSAWLKVSGELDFTEVHELIRVFGDKPILVKDYVKSQKHYWSDACFIPKASDSGAVERVVRRFVELQGADLNEGLVFREFLPLKILGSHPTSGLPLAAEVRIFWYDGEPIVVHPYWDELTGFSAELPMSELRAIATKIPSVFFTMDVAMLDDGRWTIVELGDGQVSGLPSPGLARTLYEEIARARRRKREDPTDV